MKVKLALDFSSRWLTRGFTRKGLAKIVLLVSLFILIAQPVMALEVSDVSGEFICMCGCNLILRDCSGMQCGVYDRLTNLIRDKIRQGMGKEQIFQFMKINFKEVILAAPEKKGFNLTAWIMPFAVVLAGAFGLYQILNIWVKRTSGQAGVSVASEEPKKKVSSKYSKQIAEELKEFRW